MVLQIILWLRNQILKLPLAVALAFSHCKCYETFQDVIKDNGIWKLFISDFNTFELPKEKSFREKMKEMKDLIPPKKYVWALLFLEFWHIVFQIFY